MPKLPRGLFRRGRAYYARLRVEGRDVWRSLGPEYGQACRKLAQLRAEAGEPRLLARLQTPLGVVELRS